MATNDRDNGIDEALRGIVERAFPEVTLEVVPEQDDAPPAFRSDDIRAAWQRMHDAARGREVLVLLEMLEGTWLREEERWKAVTFLGWTLQTPESLSRREAALQALSGEAAIKQRGAVPGDAVRVQAGALEAIANAPIGADGKWRCMLATLQASRSHFREILDALAGYRPAETAALADAMPILLDAMMRSERLVDLDALAALIRQIDLRSATPDVRRLLLAANSHLSSRVAAILADWEDPQAAFEIRRAIEQYRHASDPNVDGLLDALHRLEGAACAEYVAEVFRAAPAALQEHLLQNCLRRMPSAPVVRAVSEIGETTTDVDLAKAAKEYLEHSAAFSATTDVAEPVASSMAAAPASGSTGRTDSPGSADSAAATASWKPTWDDTSLSKSPAPAGSAVSAGAAPPSIQPAHEEAPSAPVDLPGGDSEARARRLAIEAEALAAIRREAGRPLEETMSWRPSAEAAAEPEELTSGPDRAGVLLVVLLVVAALVSVIVAFAGGW